MKTDSKCKCNCHVRDFRIMTNTREHKNCDSCKKALIKEEKEFRRIEEEYDD